MKQSNKNNLNSTSNTSTLQNDYSNSSKPDKYGSVEPLPESSRPRRDGPGGEDGE